MKTLGLIVTIAFSCLAAMADTPGTGNPTVPGGNQSTPDATLPAPTAYHITGRSAKPI